MLLGLMLRCSRSCWWAWLIPSASCPAQLLSSYYTTPQETSLKVDIPMLTSSSRDSLFSLCLSINLPRLPATCNTHTHTQHVQLVDDIE